LVVSSIDGESRGSDPPIASSQSLLLLLKAALALEKDQVRFIGTASQRVDGMVMKQKDAVGIVVVVVVVWRLSAKFQSLTQYGLLPCPTSCIIQ
jgi:hypothetical protein